MIEFSGDFSDNCKKCLLKNNAVVGFFASLVASIIFSVVIIIIASILNLWIITWFISGLVFVVAIATASPYIEKKKTLKLILPKRITIDNDGTMSFELVNATINKSISKINKIVDEGEWYFVKFYFPKLNGFLLQKNLIKKGSIEEFEALFQDKITRKLK